MTTTVEGRARFPANVRYPRDLRGDLETLARVLVMTPSGVQVPLGQLADVRTVTGPSMIRNENGLQRVTERLKLVVPFTFFLILFLLYANTKSLAKTLIVVLAVPFSLVGAVWLLWALDYNVSIAVWVGMIALMGLDAETGVFMLLFCATRRGQGRGRERVSGPSKSPRAVAPAPLGRFGCFDPGSAIAARPVPQRHVLCSNWSGSRPACPGTRQRRCSWERTG